MRSQGVSRFHLLQEVIDPKLYHQSMHPQKEKKMLSIDGNSPKTSKFREVKFLFLKSAPIIDKMC